MNQPSLFGDSPNGSRTPLDIWFDGASRHNPGPAAIGVVVRAGPQLVAEISRALGTTTNNVAEYEALIAGLETAAEVGARRVRIHGDSKLIVEQIMGRNRVKAAHLRPLYERARALLATFDDYDIEHVPRTENKEADALANRALDAP